MKYTDYTDERGRKYRVLLPDDEPLENAEFGIPVGPPEGVVEGLDLPEPFATRLHNELHARGVWSSKEARSPGVLQGAIAASLKVDVQLLFQQYAKIDQISQ